MKISFFIVDVFAERRFSGNQLAVFVNSPDLSDEQMLDIAREIHFSETTFVQPAGIGENRFSVRIFTPEHEVPFAGHPVLGTAFVLREEVMELPSNEIILKLPVGKIPVTYIPEPGRSPVLWMKQNQPVFSGLFRQDEIAEVLSLPVSSLDPRFPVEEVSTGLPFIIVPIVSREAVRAAKINITAYNDLISRTEAKALHIFCSEPYDQKHTLNARMFGPYYGVPEDPATGSANGCLAGYLVKNDYFEKIPPIIYVEQGYEIHRPSLVLCRATKDSDSISVEVGGSVVLVARGQMVV